MSTNTSQATHDYDATPSYAERYTNRADFLQELVDEGVLEEADTAKVHAVLHLPLDEEEQEECAA